MSEFLRLNSKDFIKGAVTAVFAAVVLAVYNIIGAPGFDLFTVDWSAVFQVSVNAAVAAFIGYIGKQLLTDEDGKLMGKV